MVIPEECQGLLTNNGFFIRRKKFFRRKGQKRLLIGIPNELEKGENRICLTPESVHILVSMGHEVLLQRGAGGNAHYTDHEYADAGATIAETIEEVYVSDIIIKATSVTMGDIVYMHEKTGDFVTVEVGGYAEGSYTGDDAEKGHGYRF